MTILALDQGTTSSRSIIYNESLQAISLSQLPFETHYPQPGWVEQSPEDIWQTTLQSAKNAIKQGDIAANAIAAIGISTQRETTVIWDRKTGEVVHRPIVWQDRRTQAYCQTIKSKGGEAEIQSRTGLLCDPYFSASKIHWILENVDGARQRAEKGELAFGTIDSYLIWRLTGGESHVTDVTNASRTSLLNIHTLAWDEELLSLFDIPRAILPEVKPNTAHFGTTKPEIFGAAIDITGVAGDQQAALIGQQCFSAGMNKCTFGTGAFLLQNTGTEIAVSKNRLLSTIAYQTNSTLHYAIEGSLFMAGAIVQWLQEKMEFIRTPQESEQLARSVHDSGGVLLIPAFVGLGAPFWQPNARAAILGMTRDTDKAHITRAALEAVVFETKALIEAMVADTQVKVKHLRVDGGMVANHWLMQTLADAMQCDVVINQTHETSALGAAMLALVGKGMVKDLGDFASYYQAQASFQPRSEKHDLTLENYARWQAAIERCSE